MSEIENQENKTEGSGSFLSNIPWKYIILGIIVIIIILAVVQLINAMAKITKPFTDLLGDAAKSATSIINNCLPQSDCVKIGNCDTCGNTSGCSCTTDGKTCQNISGRDPGGGGWFTTSCGLGIAGIVAITAVLLLGLLKLISGWKASPRVDALAKAEGKSSDEVVKELTRESLADVDKAQKEYEKDGDKLSPEGKDLIEKTIVGSKLSDREYEAAQKLPSTEEKTTMENIAKTSYASLQKEISEEKENLSEKEQGKVDETTEENKPAFEEEK